MIDGPVILALCAALSCPLLLALWRITQSWRSHNHMPDIVLVPGGDADRELAAVRIGSHSRVRAIVVSSGACGLAELEGALVEKVPILIDRRAVCTVSNFTSLVHDLVQSRVKHVLVLTSEEHAQRAFAVARIVLGSHGIVVSCERVPLDKPGERRTCEPAWRVTRDVIRAAVFVLLGAEAAWLTRPLIQFVHGQHRARDSREWLAQHGKKNGVMHYKLVVPSDALDS